MIGMRYLLAGAAGTYIPIAIISTAAAASLAFVYAFVGVLIVTLNFVRAGARGRPRR